MSKKKITEVTTDAVERNPGKKVVAVQMQGESDPVSVSVFNADGKLMSEKKITHDGETEYHFTLPEGFTATIS